MHWQVQFFPIWKIMPFTLLCSIYKGIGVIVQAILLQVTCTHFKEPSSSSRYSKSTSESEEIMYQIWFVQFSGRANIESTFQKERCGMQILKAHTARDVFFQNCNIFTSVAYYCSNISLSSVKSCTEQIYGTAVPQAALSQGPAWRKKLTLSNFVRV